MEGSDNTIFVTGATSGIGLELARRWQAAGNLVIAGGRDETKLDAAVARVAGMEKLRIDMSDAASIKAGAAELKHRFPKLNILVNNAGIMEFDAVERHGSLPAAEAMVATNLLGPIRLIDALIDHLAAGSGGAIINVTSGLAFVPLPKAAAYSATKAALHSYTISLRERLAGRVEVVEIPPPGVRTDLTPGQGDNIGYLSLEQFADEAFELLSRQPTPPEVLVERVRPMRNAEAEGSFSERLAFLSQR